MSEHGLVRLSAIGGTVLTAACVPKVPATIVIDETRRPEHEQRPEEPERPKRPPGPDRTPPSVIRAELIGNSRIRIHFSEAIVAPEGFDPADFRLSYLRVYLNQQSIYSVAYYYDPSYVNYGVPAEHTNAQVREDRLEIDFTPELAPWFCRQLEYYQYDAPPMNTDAGLFLHYASGSIPIRDEAGNPLANFGADWVMLGHHDPPQTRMQIDGQAASRAGRGLVRVACGPEIPPGPR
ncbi:MAG: hypothetical protein R6X02_19785 [Enhygromyxa sp.]